MGTRPKSFSPSEAQPLPGKGQVPRQSEKGFPAVFIVPGIRAGSIVSQGPALVTTPGSLRLSSTRGGQEDKKTLGTSQRGPEEWITLRGPVRLQLFSCQGSQDPRLPATPTGNPASLGVSQEPEGQDALPSFLQIPDSGAACASAHSGCSQESGFRRKVKAVSGENAVSRVGGSWPVFLAQVTWTPAEAS